VNKCRMGRKGIYAQHPSHQLQGHDRYMSHDQLTAIFVLSTVNNTNVRFEIWEEIKRQWLRYNNVDNTDTVAEKWRNMRWVHPRDLIFYAYCVGSIWGKLLLPFLIIGLMINMWNKKQVNAHGGVFLDTDGKLLTFLRLKALNSTILNKMFDKIVKHRFGSWGFIFKTYFRYNDHPNVLESRNI